MELTYEVFVNWLIDNLDLRGLVSLCWAVEQAGEQAVTMVEADPLHGPYTPELVFDSLFYILRDRLNVYTWEVEADAEAGVYQWVASREPREVDDHGQPSFAPRSRGDTELEAIAGLLEAEYWREQWE